MLGAMDIEERIARAVIEDAIAAGYSVSVDDGEETVLRRSRNVETICAAMSSTDSDWLHIHSRAQPVAEGDDDTRKAFGWVLLVYGNGCDVISDYTTSLEPLLTRANRMANDYDR